MIIFLVMKFVALHKNIRFEIEQDAPEVGFYIYIFDETGKCIRDYLQNDLETTMEFALEEFGVPTSAWMKEE